MTVKILLIASVLAALYWLVRTPASHNRLALTRLGGLVIAALWTIAVINPDITTRVANLIGVGRGTDLVLYIFVVAFTFSTVASHQRTRALDDRVAALTRSQALLVQRLAEHQDDSLRSRD